jgi:PAS domain S-box-containing protein
MPEYPYEGFAEDKETTFRGAEAGSPGTGRRGNTEVLAPQATSKPQEADDTYYQVFLTSPDISFIANPADSTYIEVNDAFVKNTGYSREEIVGHNIADINLFADPEEFHRMNQLLEKQGRVTDEEFSLLTKSGGIRRWICSAEIVNINGTVRLIAVATDITEQKRMEEALKFTEATFKSIHQSIIVTDNHNIITYWNEMSEELFGIKASEAIGKSIVDVAKPVLRYPGQDKELDTNFRRGYNRDEMIFNTPHGRTWVDVTIRAIEIDGKRCGNVLTFQDITERKQEEEKHRAILSTSLDGFWMIDLEGNILEVNNSYCQMIGYTREELLGMTIKDVEALESAEDIQQHISRIVEKGSDHFETKHKRKDGRIIDVDISTNYIDIGEGQISVFVHDITEHKRMDEALRASEAQFRGILRAAPLGIILERNRIALWVNEYFTRMTGYSPKEIIGTNGRALSLSGEEFEEINRVLFEGVEQYGTGETEARLLCKNGDVIDVLLKSTPLNPDDPCGGRLTTFLDITERKKRMEQEQEAKNLRELDRLRTELLANVSHELRTPLASIKGFTTVLLDYDNKLEPGEKDEYLEIINHNTDRLSELIEQLLVMSRLDAGMLTIDKEPTDVNMLCQEAIAEAKIRSPEHQFTLDLPTRLPRAFIDPRRIRQVLDNLIDNAAKFSDPGTGITIKACKNNQKEILMTVTDKGQGIPRKDLSRIFDRRFHIERKHKPGISGAGLGLSICKRLVEAHQGKIWIESQEGKGTSCFFTIAIHNQS